MNKKMLAAVAPFALALPLALASPASAAPVHRAPDLRCNVDARAVRGNQIFITLSVNGKAKGRQDLVLTLKDDGRIVARGHENTRLPYATVGLIRNLRGPDFITFSARDNTTKQQCSVSTMVWK